MVSGEKLENETTKQMFTMYIFWMGGMARYQFDYVLGAVNLLHKISRGKGGGVSMFLFFLTGGWGRE